MKTHIVVIIEGGIVQSVISTSKSLIGKEFMVIDYDTQDDDTIDIDQGDGSTSPAYVYRRTIETPGIDLKKAYKDMVDRDNLDELAWREEI